ncbi:MAG TPA: hypothetical protein VN969_34030 [Streptosporangiaceae bacterium]|nr:hypothetical protein [Streptosporangiaceae bacterium]
MLAAIVFSNAVPNEPPTCWEVLTKAAATPGCGPWVAVLIAGATIRPTASPARMATGSTDVR